MKQLWQWTATDQFGNSREYQAHGPDVTEASMLECLQEHFRNVVITGLQRIPDSAYRPATGVIESHTFDFGIARKLMKQYGATDAGAIWNRVVPKTIQRRTIERVPVIRRPSL